MTFVRDSLCYSRDSAHCVQEQSTDPRFKLWHPLKGGLYTLQDITRDPKHNSTIYTYLNS